MRTEHREIGAQTFARPIGNQPENEPSLRHEVRLSPDRIGEPLRAGCDEPLSIYGTANPILLLRFQKSQYDKELARTVDEFNDKIDQMKRRVRLFGDKFVRLHLSVIRDFLRDSRAFWILMESSGNPIYRWSATGIR